MMINNSITEQVSNFNYLGRQLGSNRYYVLRNKLQRFNYLCGKIKRALLNKRQGEAIVKFDEVLLAVNAGL
jgi:hypothetical protein